jgi:O-antigen/teichoic acid export membrane protein
MVTDMGRGTTIYLIGTVVSLLIGFITRTLIARYGTEAQYGVYSLTLAIVNMLVLYSCLGLLDGTTRYIAFYKGKGDNDKALLVGSLSALSSGIIGIIFCIVLLYSADSIATTIFHDQTLGMPLKTLAYCIPLLSTFSIFLSIFRGYGRTQEKVYFDDITKNILHCLLVLPIIFFKSDFSWFFYTFLIGTFISSIFLFVYTRRRIPLKLTFPLNGLSVMKELMLFSLPLLVVSVLQTIIGYSDILLLGYFKNADEVGLYNAASPIAQLISIPLDAFIFNFVPNIALLYAKNLIAELSNHYNTVTKWVLLASFPMTLLILIFPIDILILIWGSKYATAAPALQIITIGIFISSILGPNGTTLMVIGHSKFLMWASLVTVIISIILNFVLIPPLGIVGAALATAITLSWHCLIRHIKLRHYIKISPLKKSLFLPVGISLILFIWLSSSFKRVWDVELWMIPLFLITFYGIFILIVIFCKGFDKDDMVVISEMGKSIPILKNLIKRYSTKN